MTKQHAESWLLRCPECGEYVSVELEDGTEAGMTASAQCPAAHCFTFQYHDQTIEMRATITRARRQASGAASV